MSGAKIRPRVLLSAKGPAYHPKRNNEACRVQLRKDFEGRCAFCLWHDQDHDNGFEIDHFLPQARGGSHAYQNLRYVCEKCNRAKGDHPNESERAAGVRVLDPCAEWDYVDHLDEQPDLTLHATTTLGRNQISLFGLDRKWFTERRRERDQRHKILEDTHTAITGGNQDPDTLCVLLANRRELERLLARSLPRWETLVARRNAK